METLLKGSSGLKRIFGISAVFVTILYALPFIYLILTSLKTPSETISVPPTLLPNVWSLENYANAFAKAGVVESMLNSAQIAVISTALSLLLGIPAAYAAVRFGSKLTSTFLIAALVIRMVPAIVIGAPLASWASDLGLYDSTVAVAVAHTTIALPLVIWLMTGFFEAIPEELEEAAMLDGCGRVKAFTAVILPLTIGGVAVAGIFAFLSSWNEFIMALLMTSTEAQTTPIAIANFQTQFGIDWGSMTAISVVYSLPVVIMTLGLQKYLISGLTLGAVKG